MTMNCRVCIEGEAEPFRSIDGLDYRRCGRCEAVFLDASQLPGADAERERYELHENDPDDPGYRAFLSRLATPLLERLTAGLEGLDYGCGPGPALARMLEEAGHAIRLYDPFFHPDATALERTYDFIACTETVEHFHRPAEEFARFDRLLRPGGILAIMTSMLTDDISGGADIPVGDRRASGNASPTVIPFDTWHYRREPTHVVFYRETTFRIIADRFAWQCEFPVKDVVMMRKE